MTTAHSGSTAITLHELGHRVQKAVAARPDRASLAELEQDFWLYRRDGEPIHQFPGYPPEVMGIEDRFVSIYMGRFYGSRTSWEILPTGLEDVFFGKYGMIEKDPEFRHFILGPLASA